MSLVWLITGTSSGFGNELARSLLGRGEKVIATGRKLAALEGLKAEGADTLELDVTSPLDILKVIADKAVGLHGRVDVVVNNAGYVEIGALEELTPEETLKQFNTNVFGGLNVARAFLPHLRKERSGTIVWIGSVGGWRSPAASGLYCATKHAVRAIASSMDEEISPLGLRSIYLEPGYFRTSFLQEGNRSSYTPRIQDYDPFIAQRYSHFQNISGKQPGDPKKLVELMIDYVRKEGVFKTEDPARPDYPQGLPVGTDAYNIIKTTLEQQLVLMEKWKDVTCSTDLPK